MNRLLTILLLSCVLMAAAPAGYHPVPFPQTDQATMPLKGHNGDGTGGYCVSIVGREDLGVVDVPGFILDPIVRNRLNHQNSRTIGWTPLSTDPGVIVQEYRASTQNAFRLLALQSGDPELIQASNRPLAFPELGDLQIQLEGNKPPISTCMKSSCYGKPPTPCVPTGCGGGCFDCIAIRTPSIQ